MINKAFKYIMSQPGKSFSPGEIIAETGVNSDLLDNILALIDVSGQPRICKTADGKIKYLTGGPVSPLLIERALRCTYLAGNVISFVETDSTNDIAWGYSGSPANSGLVVLAESQRSGRGRFAGRKWYDQKGCSILMSVLLRSSVVGPDVLSIAAAIAVAESIREVCHLAVTIKWPNDIIFCGRKLAGLMVEARNNAGQEWYVLGLGVNCQQKPSDFALEIADRASSISSETGLEVDRDWLVINILDKLDGLLVNGDDKAGLSARWSNLSSTVSGSIILAENGVRYEGEVVQVEPFQGLTIKLADGSLRDFDARKATVLAF
jgi:BirA family transcriptional regulator, biotin operon repressor / biotin---[acetyl-CoA-carboxylase] ligase